MRYDLFGQIPKSGQWRWQETRARIAISNHIEFCKNVHPQKTLDEWYIENLQAGINLDFLRLYTKDNGEDVVQYYVPPQGTRLVSDNWLDISSSGNFTEFEHEKSLELLHRVISWSTGTEDCVLDFFGGSGTTAHAVINLNQLDGGNRKYILVEMAEYFNTVLKPRIQKVAYAAEWQKGKPVNSGLFSSGISHMFHYLRLESYDDTFHNIAFRTDSPQQELLALDDYLLTYLLPHETQESPTLLAIAQLRTPFDYKLNVAETGGALHETTVDLMTTFNFLIGLRVCTIRRYTNANGGSDTGTQRLVRVTGVNRQGERICILWRNVPATPAALDAEREWLQRAVLHDITYDRLYINGDSTLPDATILDAEFKRLMMPREGI